MTATDVTVPVGASPRLTRGGLGHVAGLDGLRAVAVGAVLLFHHGAGWASGGFLGVSLFLVLSGFLIGALLGREVDRTGAVDLWAFAARRARRLVPAAVVTTVAVVVAGRLLGPDGPVADRADVLATLGFVENWHLLVADRSYGDLFATPSPLLHAWSLGVEAQFYVLVAPLIALVLVRRRGDALLYALLGASVAGHLALGWAGADDAVYYSLPTRLPELLVGVLLARRLAPPALGGRRLAAVARHRVGVAGVVGLVALGAAVVLVELDDAVVHRGLLLGAAVAGGAVVAAAATPGTVVARGLSAAPLVVVGRLSYGIYLVHWPLFLWLTPDRAGVDGAALLALRVAATLAAAVTSWHLVERRWLRPTPRHHDTRSRRRPAAVLAIAAVAASVAAPLATADDFAAVEAAIDEAAVVPAPPGAVRVAFYGDSTALLSSFATREWGLASEELAVVRGSAELGCGIVHRGEIDRAGATTSFAPQCDWPRVWAEQLASRPDVAVVQTGPADVADHRLPGDDAWRGPGDPTYDAALLAEMVAAVDVLSSRGATVVWLTSPVVDRDRWASSGSEPDDGSAEPARMERYNELVRRAAVARPALRVVDLAAWVASLPADVDARLRPDGVHFARDAGAEVGRWIGPAILEAAGMPVDGPATTERPGG